MKTSSAIKLYQLCTHVSRCSSVTKKVNQILSVLNVGSFFTLGATIPTNGSSRNNIKPSVPIFNGNTKHTGKKKCLGHNRITANMVFQSKIFKRGAYLPIRFWSISEFCYFIISISYIIVIIMNVISVRIPNNIII